MAMQAFHILCKGWRMIQRFILFQGEKANRHLPIPRNLAVIWKMYSECGRCGHRRVGKDTA